MADNIDIVFIPTEKITEVYPMVAEEINATLLKAENGYASQDVIKELTDGNMNLWLVWDIENKKKLGFVITEILQRPQFKIFSIFMVLGQDRLKWQIKAQNTFEEYAKKNGCYKSIHLARKGWSKVFKQYGYRETHIVLEKKNN